ncbi:MAG TPA: hypothetical protein VGY58_11980 [Gemmataceae bacterium]|nr:hypothetical protein [Gemmataceae bacterium]
MASAGLAGTAPSAQDSQNEHEAEAVLPDGESAGRADPCWRFPTFSMSGGVDLLNAYFRRGYLIEEGGPILQPFLTGSTVFTPTQNCSIRPYVTAWDSTNFRGPGETQQNVAEFMAGVFTTYGAATLDVNYGYYSRLPLDSFTSVNEVGARIACDVLRPWQAPGQPCAWSLRPTAALYWEFMEFKKGGAGYAEAGIEPAFRIETREHRAGVTFPVLIGLGMDGYYANAHGSNATLGYISAGVSGSVALPAPPGFGQWYMNASLLYLHLTADNLKAINHGDADALVGKIGIGFIF